MLNDWFNADNLAVRDAFAINYDYALLLLSLIVAILAAYAGFDALDRFSAARRNLARTGWLASGAITLGGGIWAMQSIALLAVETERAIRYDVALTILASFIAIGASGIALRFVGSATKSAGRLLACGGILGVGIGLTHFVSVASMQMGVTIHYNPALFAISVAVAFGLSSLTLYVFRKPHRNGGVSSRFGCAVLMGFSVAVVHFIGMAATYFVPEPGNPVTAVATLDDRTMAIFIGAGVFVATQLALIGSIVHRQFQNKDRKLASQGIYLEKIVKNAIDGIILIKPNGEIMVVNPIVESLFGFSSDELIGTNISILMSDETAQQHDSYLRDAQAAEPRILDKVRELNARRRDGFFFPIDLAVSSIDLPDGRYFMGVIRDISERKQAEEEREQLISELMFNKALLEEQAEHSTALAEELALQKQLVEENKKRSDHLARHDALTHLPNRRYFFERLEETLNTSQANEDGVALLYIDLDKFKSVNDTMGHERGDKLLIEVAGRIRKTVSEADAVARLGGDEFAVMARNRSAEQACSLGERIRKALRITVETPNGPIVTGASIGIACFPEHGDNIDDLMKSADKAMYRAKNGGRDQVHLFNFYDRAPQKNTA